MKSNEWAYIPGYKTPYRINRSGVVQQLRHGKWATIKSEVTPRRTEVRLRGLDGKQKRVGVFRLLDRCFCGGYGEKHGLRVGPKNGVRSDCTLENLTYRTQSEIGRANMTRTFRKPVIRYDRNGNTTLYRSVTEAARANGLTTSTLDRRMYGGVMDPRGYRFEPAK